ncbi:NACHT domain-containing NTPase [Leptolyngbya sp. CCNP1308]|uniref:NACHT domain-containing protein n=1 Tax=Leptolyngbya sp. CCNP1308 TaxID=3110255 RepID=UPI002B202B5D|nr:NACHT domain-containing NTPase [Leptolyngbya sp. CCNP1308]MEA5447945.1 NACHT domain-containing NTPase [Leptolyngbya sp. CCNP1308]
MTVNNRLQLFNTLAALPPPTFNKLLFAIQPPDGVVAGPTATQGDRTAQLLQWAESSPRHDLAFVNDVLSQLDSLPNPPESIIQIRALRASARRSLTVTPDGIQQINRALTERGWSREDLASVCACSRQPAIKFCSGKPVSNKLFVSFCNALDLDWEDIAGLKAPTNPKHPKPDPDIDALVQTVRAQVYGDIQGRCGTMRVLDMEQPIGLGDIYTSVNILEKISGRRRLELEELLQDCDPKNFDRFLLGQVRHKRIPGLQAVEEHRQLMILGKPGAGKTTFMKRLAILCNEGKFQPQRVPVFVTLKDYAEAKGKPKLHTYIQNQRQACGVKETDVLTAIFLAGQSLVLLDGLDEVSENDHDRVLQDIKTFTQQFRDCQCVITCRIAAREYIFEQFTEVEVADFNQKQIAEFANKWFTVKHDPKKAKTFIQRLKDNKPIQELATNPLLLTLLCLVFGEAADFPANRAELYKEGLDVLLKKWDGKRNIERDQVYKKLSLKRKEDLLSQLAFETFERGEYFFKQATVEQHIICYIRNLPGASDEQEVLQLDGEAVLKSIEAQHGLLVERARGIYSFSHLTFQEYFTAQNIISPTAALNQALQSLVNHITEKRYREIFFLTAGMLSEADTLLVLMKQKIDQIVADSTLETLKLQSLLAWMQQKNISVNVHYKTSAVRAFYLAYAYNLDLDLAHDLDFSLALADDLDLSYARDRVRDLYYGRDHNFSYTDDLQLKRALTRSLNRARTISHVNSLALALDRALFLALIISYALDLNLDRALDLALDCDIDLALDRAERSIEQDNQELKLIIQGLRAKLPNRKNREVFKQWWQANGANWTEHLRITILEQLNIGYDWQLSNAQKEKLEQYYNANKLLVDCLNSDCYVTKATRQYIEDTLLLPLSEIEKYPVPDAIANL